MATRKLRTYLYVFYICLLVLLSLYVGVALGVACSYIIACCSSVALPIKDEGALGINIKNEGSVGADRGQWAVPLQEWMRTARAVVYIETDNG